MSAAFWCAQFGIDQATRHDHAAYLGDWLAILKADARALVTACSKAQHAVDFLNELASDGRRPSRSSGRRSHDGPSVRHPPLQSRRLHRHRRCRRRRRSLLRCVGSTLIELPLIPEPGAGLWIATVHAATELADGWARHLWEPTVGRGWTIPERCAFGSLIEFGADTAEARRQSNPHRWYGIAIAHEPQWLVVHGPFDGPAGADSQAREWLTKSRAEATERNDPHQRISD